jgi:Fe2+ or Zn2+ uptake regulation protein
MDPQPPPKPYDATISEGGFRLTRQRREVYEALIETRDHPTAVDVFTRVKVRMPGISLATVYNCLDTLTQCGLVKQVNVDRAPSRFCPNLQAHAHFFCEQCHGVIDVDLPHPEEVARFWKLPSDCLVTHHDITLRGICPTCATGTETFLEKN